MLILSVSLSKLLGRNQMSVWHLGPLPDIASYLMLQTQTNSINDSVHFKIWMRSLTTHTLCRIIFFSLLKFPISPAAALYLDSKQSTLQAKPWWEITPYDRTKTFLSPCVIVKHTSILVTLMLHSVKSLPALDSFKGCLLARTYLIVYSLLKDRGKEKWNIELTQKKDSLPQCK